MRFKRIAADLTDLVICAVLAAVFSVLPAAAASGFRAGASVLLIVEIAMTYAFFLLKDVFERSFGKRLFRIKIVNWEGKSSTVGQRIIRNIPLPLFPVSFILTVAGYDTLGDHLAATCVAGQNDNGVPGMRKGNTVFRIVTLSLCAAIVIGFGSYYLIRDLVIKYSDGYETLSGYMAGDEIAAKYGPDPVWKVKEYSKKNDSCIYTVEVNAGEITVTTVNINGKWFVLGLQTEKVNNIIESIKKAVSDKTVYVALADLDFDGKEELIEFCVGEDSGTLCNIYEAESGELAGSFSYDNGSVASVGSWTKVHDINGSDRVILEYSRYNSVKTEKHVSMIEKKDGTFILREMFTEIYTTEEKTVTGEDGTEMTVKDYKAGLFYNGRQLSPLDYYSNYGNYEARYTPVNSGLYTYKWQNAADLDGQALDAATTLIYNMWGK